MKLSFTTLFLMGILAFASCNENKKEEVISVKTSDLAYSSDSTNMNGFVAWNESSDKKRPVVLIVHEWWGLNEYTQARAKQLAEMGYLAIAVDLYGDRKQGENPEAAGALAMPFYTNPEMAKQRFDAALNEILKHPVADKDKVAAIGYCFGGAMVLNMARMGADLDGVVSFHGNLAGVPVDKNTLKADILICHGEADEFVSPEELTNFKKEMDSLSIPYTFKSYPNATHAFTNPQATATGQKFSIPIAYNAAADSASWKHMTEFFGKIFK